MLGRVSEIPRLRPARVRNPWQDSAQLNSQRSRDLVESARNIARRKVWDASQAIVSRKTRGAVSESGGGQVGTALPKTAREIQITPFTPSQTTRELVIGSPWAEGPGPCADLPRTGPCARTRCCYWQPLRMRSKWPGLCCVRKCDNRAVWTRPSQPDRKSVV